MARYVMANRRAGKFTETEKVSTRAAVGRALDSMAAGINVRADYQPEDATAGRIVVFDAEPAEMAAISARIPPDVILEPEILHARDLVPLDFQLPGRNALAAPLDTGSGKTLKVRVRGNGGNLKGAEVIVNLRAIGGAFTTEQTGITDGNGRVTFHFSSIWTPTSLVAVPAGDFWTMVVLGPSNDVTVECPALPADGPLEWWHETLGISRFRKTRGNGIRVGVCDTGIGPHPNLSHATDVGAFIGGEHLPDGGADADSHGSHVCGIIGAKPADPGDYGGVAPGVKLFSARVFPPGAGAANVDIANAIEELSRNRDVDLINLSLGAAVGSEIIRDRIQDARERGTVCICAAGNSAGSVEFPAAFAEAVAVSALGLLGWGPDGSLASFRLPSEPEKFGDGNLYLANFSCFGPEIVCAAPGVGYISTVPARHGLEDPYGAMGGTSMASPAACGALAALLAGSDDYKETPRDITRSQLALSILRNNARDAGLKMEFQGHGMLEVS